ncbi:hypothetical protein G6O69_38790 [Pseudenhygromyxa sp. WMMC2535]|uniref:hypothetical protein n=1 Tax=Pseudenhygromyxa sp. WMMC2535 TaxID=2712867 RepID=UPI0015952B7C|nr:hypothetical protein [Pseudenhygromyxa sp. WMMC2535]NVB43808.1 hypothetical protein [Pseudenhygromyxa sp. WMMC2535]
MKAVALIHLGRLDEAREVLERRAAIDPDGYATHANLGTLYTFNGGVRARARAHRPRPRARAAGPLWARADPRQLVEFLASLEAGEDVGERDFLGLELSDEQRYEGSVAAYEAAGPIDDSVIDALVAMIAVYGAESISHIHYALANALALRGERRLPTAPTSAPRASPPAAGQVLAVARGPRAALHQRALRAQAQAARGLLSAPRQVLRGAAAAAGKYRKAYAAGEEKAVADGLPVWTRAGLDAIYEQRGAIEIEVIGAYPSYHPRCPAPGVIRSAGQEPYEGRRKNAWRSRSEGLFGCHGAVLGCGLGCMTRSHEQGAEGETTRPRPAPASAGATAEPGADSSGAAEADAGEQEAQEQGSAPAGPSAEARAWVEAAEAVASAYEGEGEAEAAKQAPSCEEVAARLESASDALDDSGWSERRGRRRGPR